jgi:hypothetical protein
MVLGVVLKMVPEGGFTKYGEQAKRGGAQIVAGRTAPKKRRPTPTPKAIALAELRKHKAGEGELKCKLGELELPTTGAKQALFNRLAGHLKPGQRLKKGASTRSL